MRHSNSSRNSNRPILRAQRTSASTSPAGTPADSAAGSDLPAVWRAPTTTQAERKELLGLLIKQIALTPVGHPNVRRGAALGNRVSISTDGFFNGVKQGDHLV